MSENKSVVEYTTAAIRSIAASFPVAASIATGWSEYKNIKQSQHISEILEEFAKRISLLVATA